MISPLEMIAAAEIANNHYKSNSCGYSGKGGSAGGGGGGGLGSSNV